MTLTISDTRFFPSAPRLAVHVPVRSMLPKAADLITCITCPTFLVLQGLFFAGYGLKEIVWDGIIMPPDHAVGVHHAALSVFQKMQAAFPIAHGLLFLCSGTAGTLAALGLKKTSPWLEQNIPFLKGIEMGSFLSACLMSLIFNIKAFEVAQNDPVHRKTKENSAIMGIISSLNYLVWGALSIMGAAASFAFVFCLVALATGSLKIIYDFFYG